MGMTTSDTKTTLDAAERELRDLLAEEANGPAALRKAALAGDMAAVRGQQARQALLPILVPAARERVLRARLAHQATERAALDEGLATRRADQERLGDAVRLAEAALLATREACYGPGVWVADTERRIELIEERHQATIRELAALLGKEVGDDGELHDADEAGAA